MYKSIFEDSKDHFFVADFFNELVCKPVKEFLNYPEPLELLI